MASVTDWHLYSPLDLTQASSGASQSAGGNGACETIQLEASDDRYDAFAGCSFANRSLGTRFKTDRASFPSLVVPPRPADLAAVTSGSFIDSAIGVGAWAFALVSFFYGLRSLYYGFEWLVDSIVFG